MPDSTVPATATSRNPATGAVIASYPYQTPHQVEQLLQANAAAFQVWRALPMHARAASYRRLSAILRDRSDTLAGLITSEMGKTIAAARSEVEKCATTLDWLADHGPAILADEAVAVDGDDQVYVSYLPATDARIPAGGVKKSGYGRELSHFGLREFTNAQAVWARTLD